MTVNYKTFFEQANTTLRELEGKSLGDDFTIAVYLYTRYGDACVFENENQLAELRKLFAEIETVFDGDLNDRTEDILDDYDEDDLD